jgi:subtilisin family serine protease
MPRRLLAAFAAVVLVVGQAGSALAAASAARGPGAPATSAPIQKGLLEKLATGKTDTFVVEFAAKADLRGATKIAGHTARGKFVLDTLTANARKSQATAQALAKQAGIKAKSYWLYNEMIVHGTAKQASQFAKLKGVTLVRAEKTYPLVKPVPTKVAIQQAIGDPEWGVAKIRAPEAWAEGILGQGVVVSSVDTGVDFTHPALVNQYRGNNGDGTFTHDYNWWDPSGICGGEPCDNVGHGTHTMGTMVGGDGPGPFTPDTGVAPGARWIAAKGCEDLGCSEDSLLSAGQWILAPTDLNGENPDPSKRPDIVNNSWGGDPNDTFYLATVQAWRAAGIIPVFSSGNPGPDCGQGSAPGDFGEVFSAGATDIDDNIADFSGRGPSPFGKINPDVAAPGVDVISSVPGGGYEAFSGTSMAAPHVSGTIALALSAKPALLGDPNNYGPLTDAVRTTAVDHLDDSCGGAADGDPNNVYGDGRIDAKAAADLIATGGTLSGTITDQATSAPIAGATVTASNGERTFDAVTDTSGNYTLHLAAGAYTVTANAFGYATAASFGVTIQTDQTTDQDFALDALPRFTVTGHVRASEDGSPIADATVRAIGTPVPPATTNAAGAYSLELPIGDYTLRAAGGGCTEQGDADISLVDHDITQDFALFRKLDDFGHGCRPIAFNWVDAGTQSALYGEELVGRLRLPFSFEFYGEAYSQIWLSENGYVNFLAPDAGNFIPSSIPSAATPNAAIYPFWQDMTIDAQSSIDYATVGTAPNRAFVIEYSSMQIFGSPTHVSFEIKLWEDGRIDMLYGPNPASPGDGRSATIGIENADGTDALQFGFLDRGVIDPNSAFRYEHVPSGLVHGTVTDANDGDPVAGAAIVAAPGLRRTTTDADGNYSLRLRPGAYTLTASATNYVDTSHPATVVDEGDVTIDFSLDAPVGAVAPDSVNQTVDYGETTSVDLTVSNTGSASLAWEAKERNLGSATAELPQTNLKVTRKAIWGRQPIPAAFPRIHDTTPGPADLSLSTIITDPAGDSLDLNDVTTVRAGGDGETVAGMAIDFSPSTPMNAIGGYVYFDTDQDPATGLPAEALFGKPTQDIGMEYFADLFELNDGIVPIWSADTGDLVAIVDAFIDGTSVRFDLPLEALGGDDGFINTGMVVGLNGPSDWAPDVGHGTIEPFSDAPWVSESPESGSVPAGGSQTVTLDLGGATLPPGEYHASVVFVTNSPRQPQLPVDVTLTVTMPPEFGAITGTVSDAHTSEPLAGASVDVHTTWKGAPLVLSATTADDGTYSIVGPSGTWTADYSLDGFVPLSKQVTIVKGVTTPGADAALHRDQPHATSDPGSLTFVLTPGRTAHGTVNLGNAEGHEPLTFTIDEVKVGGGGAAITVKRAGVVTGKAPAGYKAKQVKKNIHPADTTGSSADVLVVMDELPWGSEALFNVLTDDGVVFDTINSDSIGGVALAHYNLVILANDQPQSFYDNYTANLGAFEAYVNGGGFLWVSAASQGFNGGDFEGGVLPGGATVHDAFEDSNKITDPAHPIVAGMPNPFTGSSASHETFADLVGGADVIATLGSGADPTLIEYDLGAGHVLATAQPYDFGLDNGQDTGQILINGVPYAYDKAAVADASWLTESPTQGTVAVGGSQAITVSVDSTGLAPGLYRAAVRIRTNDPDNPRLLVPVTLVVPKYQQGVNAGGSAYVDPHTGDRYATDRAFSTGGFGYVGGSARSTNAGIDGTDRDPLYQTLRQGMSAYRFAVPNGVYEVDLSFAELQLQKAGGRVFSVSLEGSQALSNLDVFAAAGGQRVAYDQTLIVEVTDGVLDIGFTAQRGDQPIINAILVTELPPGAPGN